MASRTVNAGACTSRIAVSYRAKYIEDERVELTLDSVDANQVLQLRVYDPAERVIVERVMRHLPMTLNFKAPVEGRYEMEVSTVGNKPRAGRSFSWDWDASAGGDGESKDVALPSGVMAIAFLDVS